MPKSLILWAFLLLYSVAPSTSAAELQLNHLDPYDPITVPMNDPILCEQDFLDCIDNGISFEECWTELVGCVEATITIFPENPNAPEPELFEAPVVEEELEPSF